MVIARLIPATFSAAGLLSPPGSAHVPCADGPGAGGLTSREMREQVVSARAVQRRRFAAAGTQNDGTTTNATMSPRQVRGHCKLDEAGESLLKQAMTEMGLSARAHDKVLRIARTIADIEGEPGIQSHHIAEAVQYRRLDRKL